jgi:DNA-binding response OmpR family regulator
MIIRLLVVDDEDDTRRLVAAAFKNDKGYQVAQAASADEALKLMSSDVPDLAILDYNMPGRDGRSLCRSIRQNPDTAPVAVLMLTAVDNLQKKVDTLESGADDYLTKPFQVLELKARVRALLRRKTPWLVQSRPLELGQFTIEPENFKVYVKGKDVPLTKVEFEILYLLAVNAGRLISRVYIANRVLDQEYSPQSRTLNVHMSNLREKLGPAAGRIETERGLGYIFLAEDPS